MAHVIISTAQYLVSWFMSILWRWCRQILKSTCWRIRTSKIAEWWVFRTMYTENFRWLSSSWGLELTLQPNNSFSTRTVIFQTICSTMQFNVITSQSAWWRKKRFEEVSDSSKKSHAMNWAKWFVPNCPSSYKNSLLKEKCCVNLTRFS